ncbi:MAG: aminopeptidase, partial [Sphingobacteriaceae bacterium]|nr:aminopeptidase [Sphingobacteriaceae bacterium]
MKKVFCCVLLFLTSVACNAQDVKYAKKIVEKLSSKSLWGRGYTKNGMDKAADFIIQEFTKNNLVPMSNEGFKQYFYHPVNTFDGKMEVKINRQKLIAGKDFIVKNESIGVRKKCFLKQIDSVNFEAMHQPIKVKLSDKLTWSVATDTSDYTEIIVKKSVLKSVPKEIAVNIT